MLAVLSMAAWTATHLSVRNDVTAFLPAGADPVLAALSRRLSESELSRTVVLTVASHDLEAALAGAARIAEGLRANPDVAWVRDGIDDDAFERVYALYFPRRHAFLSDEPEREIPALTRDTALTERARTLKRGLAGPRAALLERIAPADPLLAFASQAERLREAQSQLALRGGRLVTRGGGHAVVFFGTRPSAYDAARQRAIQRALARLEREASVAAGAPLRVEQSGVGRFSARIEESLRRDVQRVAVASTLGIGALLLAFFRSPAALLLALLPGAVGLLAALTVGTLVFGTLNGLSLAFGLALLGVSIDYSLHWLCHRALRPEGEPAAATLRRLRPSLVLGGLTTLASLVGLAFANFPGFHQMGLLAAIGVGTALGVALTALPALAGRTRAMRSAPALADRLAHGVWRLQRHRAAWGLLALACLGAGLAALPRVHWVDDLRELTVLDPALLAEEERVRERVSHFDANRFAVVLAEPWQVALAANDRLHTVLEAEVRDGALAGFRSLHPFLRSEQLQRRNEEEIRVDPTLPARVDALYAAQGFRPGAFAPFAAALAAPPPPPLRLEALREAGFEDVVRGLVVEVEGSRAILTWLRGVEDAERVERAVAGVEGAQLFDQRRFLREVYREYRTRTLQVVASGAVAVLALLWLRYRRLRPTLAAFLPSLLVALALAALAAAFDVRANLLHLVGLVLVMGMGVDYGIFVVDSAGRGREVGVTLLALGLSCATTLLMFGVLAFSAHPVLHALGATAAVGVALSFALAPLALVVLRPGRPETAPDREAAS